MPKKGDRFIYRVVAVSDGQSMCRADRWSDANIKPMYVDGKKKVDNRTWLAIPATTKSILAPLSLLWLLAFIGFSFLYIALLLQLALDGLFVQGLIAFLLAQLTYTALFLTQCRWQVSRLS